MSITLKYYGYLAERTGIEAEILATPRDTATLKKDVLNRFPKLSEGIMAVAVNQSICRENTKLKDGDEVALLPPFAGG